MNTKELKGQRQDAMRDQLDDLLKIAVREGMYDAHQFILDCLNTRAPVAGLTEGDVRTIVHEFVDPIAESLDPTAYDDGAEYAALEIKDRLLAALSKKTNEGH